MAEKRKFAPQLTMRLALMIGALFVLFSVLVTVLFYSISRNLLQTHHKQSLLRDAYNIAKNIAEEHSIESEQDLYSELFNGESQYSLLLLERLSNADIWVIDADHALYTHQNDTLNYVPDARLPAFAEQICALAFLGRSDCAQGVIDGKSMLVAGAPMTNSDGQIVAVVLLCSDFSGLAHSTQQSLTILAASLAGALVLILTATVLFAHSFVRPIRGLKTTALRLAAGDYRTEARAERSDEVGELARAMDVLAVRLEQARVAREQTEHEKQEFLSRISHELKTPVTVIRGSLEALDEGLVKTEEERAVYYHQMLTESIWLQKLITSLLDLTRLQTLDYPLARDEVDLVELLGDVLMSARALAQRQQITVACTPPAAPCTVQGDYDRLRQLLMILVDNAVCYSPPHTRITLALDPHAQTLSVQDQGAGIPPDVLPDIFNAYHRGHRQDHRGTGLGLAIAAEIARRHSFTLSAESPPAPGEPGSRFVLCFANTAAR